MAHARDRNLTPTEAEAARLYDGASFRLMHNYVPAEFFSLCKSRGVDRRATLDFVSDLIESPEVGVVWVDELLHGAELSLLQARLDKGYSFCDAASFVLAGQLGIVRSLTPDNRFNQEGFVRLPPA